MNISSIVVKCAPKYLEETLKKLNDSGLCEVFASDESGRIIAVIEGDSTESESEKLRGIQAMEHILSAEMVYAYSESEFAPEEGKFDRVSSELVESLNTEIPAEQIEYRGHLKDK
jgi:nitrate reductase NapD